jgi:hypothetical protein
MGNETVSVAGRQGVMLRSITKRPVGIKIAVVGLISLAIGSTGGGSTLLDDPSGRSMGIQFIIPYMPFNLQDFFLVGVWLITVYGMLSIILAAGLWFGKNWAWIGSIGLGAVVVVWILAEVVMFYSFGFIFFYPLIGGIGVLVIVALGLRSTRQYFVKQ